MIYIKTQENSFVENILYVEPKNKEGWIELSSIPEPEEREGMYAEMYYRNGSIEYEYKPIIVPEHQPEELGA